MDFVRSSHSADLIDQPGGVFVRDADALGPETVTLLQAAVKYYRTWLQEYRDDPALAAKMAPTLQQTAGAANVSIGPPVTGFYMLNV